jgi:hypothetical protein
VRPCFSLGCMCQVLHLRKKKGIYLVKIAILHFFQLPGTLKGFCKSDFVPNVYLGVSLRASRLFSGLYVPGAAEISKMLVKPQNYSPQKSIYQGRCWASEGRASSQKSILGQNHDNQHSFQGCMFQELDNNR